MKPIKLTEEMKQALLAEFTASLEKAKIADGRFSYTRQIAFDKDQHAGRDKAAIVFTPTAWMKMSMLIQQFSTEVAWHGLVNKIETKGSPIYQVYDILVYDQIVDGSNVNTDQEGYEKFMMSLTDDQANHMFMHGHSHVNFGTTPSQVDKQHQEDFLKNVRQDGFCLFMIWNKRYEHWACIYDVKDNILYENNDVIVDVISDDGESAAAFLHSAVEKVKERKPATTWSGTTYPSNYGTAKTTPIAKQDEKKSKKKKSIWEDEDEGYSESPGRYYRVPDYSYYNE